MGKNTLADEIRSRVADYLRFSLDEVCAHRNVRELCASRWSRDRAEVYAVLALALIEREYDVRFPSDEELEPYLHMAYEELARYILPEA